MIIDRSHPTPLVICERHPLTKPSSTKKTYHLTLQTKEHPLDFKVGDSLGIYPENDPEIVDAYIQALQATGKEEVYLPKTDTVLPLSQFLKEKANLSRTTSAFLQHFSSHPSISRILSSKEELATFCKHKEPLSLLLQYGNPLSSLRSLPSLFAPLLPRFYSIASSPKKNPSRIDLTVSLTSYYIDNVPENGTRYGVASHFLCHLAEENKTLVHSYVQPTPHFTLPVDPNTPIIMVGPGTGVAPFRAFLQERIETNAPGKNWLFFGERNAESDFFYEPFWKELVKDHKLRLSTAFSRDQSHKVYVQHKMLEEKSLLWQWLQEGAIFYVCGEAHPMAKEVEEAFLQIAREEGNLSDLSAKAYLSSLRVAKKYLSDVY